MMNLDIDEFRPMVDGWFKMKKVFTIEESEKYVKLKTGNIDLVFAKQADGTLIYDGWGCDLHDMGIVIPESPHNEDYDENKPGT